MDNTASCITQLLLVYDVHLHSYVCGTFYKFSCKLLKNLFQSSIADGKIFSKEIAHYFVSLQS